MERQKTWGAWTFVPTRFVLRFRRGRNDYDVRLDECRNPGEVLDWIMQLRKNWAAAEDLGHLVLALGDVLRPQAKMCSFGANNSIDPREVAAANGYTPGPKARVDKDSNSHVVD